MFQITLSLGVFMHSKLAKPTTSSGSGYSSGYEFDNEGRLVNTTIVDEESNSFKFTTQAEYEQICAEVTNKIYEMMTKPPYSLRKVNFHCEEQVEEEDPFVFISPNFEDAECLVVLIHGSGAVRAGQWSRRLILNESLEVGSQLPYIRHCIERGWAVLVMNTNDNKYTTQSGEEATKEHSGSAVEHGLNAWKQLVLGKAEASQIAVVAHSFGGVVIWNILNELAESKEQLRRIRAVCLTDAIFDPKLLNSLACRPPVRNWLCSDQPLDEPIKNEGFEEKINFSAGTKEHERSSHAAMNSVFQYIEQKIADEPCSTNAD